ncbi:hypothetical protein [Amycolatopsis sp. M39]|uniref:hypothetical protein n=1 Tax=Amycolatopsis sp. M39 TaxID=1825094 RepID=UPI0007E1C439|nr:hypothetical protein [Amycolatopsis sp. M39]OAP21522.1 hypothetical protein A4R44_07781 [Amycolatopsis sp. M39]
MSTTIADARIAGSATTAAMLHTALVSTYATVGARLYSRCRSMCRVASIASAAHTARTPKRTRSMCRTGASHAVARVVPTATTFTSSTYLRT